MTRIQRIPAPVKFKNKPQISVRQLCFITAFILPTAKLLEMPSRLAKNALGDLLLPAFLQFLLQFLGLCALLFITNKTGKSIFEIIEKRFGGVAMKGFYLLLTLYYLFSVLLPILDSEKFVHAVFYDTAPSRFTFTPFFFLSAKNVCFCRRILCNVNKTINYKCGYSVYEMCRRRHIREKSYPFALVRHRFVSVR